MVCALRFRSRRLPSLLLRRSRVDNEVDSNTSGGKPVLIKRSRARHLPLAVALFAQAQVRQRHFAVDRRGRRQRPRAGDGQGPRVLRGGDGNDQIRTRNSTAGSVDCGSGNDIATIDKTSDTLNACERIRYS